MAGRTSICEQAGTLVADGAIGTLLAERGAARGMAPGTAAEAFLLEAPELVEQAHAEYVDAGADILLTCTFAGSREQLARHRLDAHFDAVHQIAAQIARSAAGDDRFVFGDLGPCGLLFPPMGKLTEDAAVASYAERAQALGGTGLVDAFLVETQYDLRETECAVRGVRSVSDLPIAVSMSFDSRGKTMMGVAPKTFAEAMRPFNVTWIGANCGSSVSETLEAIRQIKEACPDLPLWAKPNAGLPQVVGGETRYTMSPETFAEDLQGFLREGVRVIGAAAGRHLSTSHVWPRPYDASPAQPVREGAAFRPRSCARTRPIRLCSADSLFAGCSLRRVPLERRESPWSPSGLLRAGNDHKLRRRADGSLSTGGIDRARGATLREAEEPGDGCQTQARSLRGTRGRSTLFSRVTGQPPGLLP